ncbi:hypothetical protein HYN43_015940 [Mucilaginibacter celer]|uniref:Uncharacterized protein n=1 Tax=Mucilaginibacter celer TaxID=2305508 RepID=A0A494VZF9_9SPHI|nr:hypothetical protein HYN43_015940 [Mucilaginibacter celer]
MSQIFFGIKVIKYATINLSIRKWFRRFNTNIGINIKFKSFTTIVLIIYWWSINLLGAYDLYQENEMPHQLLEISLQFDIT